MFQGQHSRPDPSWAWEEHFLVLQKPEAQDRRLRLQAGPSLGELKGCLWSLCPGSLQVNRDSSPLPGWDSLGRQHNPKDFESRRKQRKTLNKCKTANLMATEKVMVMTGHVPMLKLCRCSGINVSDAVLITNINTNNSHHALSTEHRAPSTTSHNLHQHPLQHVQQSRGMGGTQGVEDVSECMQGT